MRRSSSEQVANLVSRPIRVVTNNRLSTAPQSSRGLTNQSEAHIFLALGRAVAIWRGPKLVSLNHDAALRIVRPSADTLFPNHFSTPRREFTIVEALIGQA
jgi:hypothetical protein